VFCPDNPVTACENCYPLHRLLSPKLDMSRPTRRLPGANRRAAEEIDGYKPRGLGSFLTASRPRSKPEPNAARRTRTPAATTLRPSSLRCREWPQARRDLVVDIDATNTWPDETAQFT
jgi:hypothetical protein